MGVRKKKFSVASKSMPCFVSASECGIKIDAMRLKTAFVFAFLRQNGANFDDKNSSHSFTATFEPPKRHLFSKFIETILERPICR